ncbi:MAG: hypothetical protein HYX74_00740 [Acidobacteria bacterium]|nr:hypothetical protein [Acidobacteriota bacterium]
MRKTLLSVVLLFLFSLVSTAATLAQGEDQVEQIKPDFLTLKQGDDPKHVPKLEAPASVTAGQWFDVTISVGKGAWHPSLSEHHVRYIALYKEDVEIARTYLHPVYSRPKVTYTIALEDDYTMDKDGKITSRKDKTVMLRAVEEPTHTAAWQASQTVVVKSPQQ